MTCTRRRWAPVPAVFEDSDQPPEPNSWMTRDRVNVFFSLQNWRWSTGLDHSDSVVPADLLPSHASAMQGVRQAHIRSTARLVSAKLPKNGLPAWLLLLWIWTNSRFKENERLIEIGRDWWRMDRPKYYVQNSLGFLFVRMVEYLIEFSCPIMLACVRKY